MLCNINSDTYLENKGREKEEEMKRHKIRQILHLNSQRCQVNFLVISNKLHLEVLSFLCLENKTNEKQSPN